MLEEFSKHGLRIIVDNKYLNAKENMDIDKELFYSFKKGDLPILRLYTWQKSFTYGVSQDIDKIDFKYGISSAKRITGGGILLHGHDVSYSIIMDTLSLKGMNVKKSYECLCSFILEFYHFLGLKPEFAKNIGNIELKKNSFCQVGFEPYDIVIEGKKIGGNAQKRSRDKLIQHGSIPLKNIKHPKGGYSLEHFGILLDENEVIEGLIKNFIKLVAREFDNN